MGPSTLKKYEIDHTNRTLRFMLTRPDGSEEHKSVELVFQDVEGYLLKHDRGTDSVLAVEEQPLSAFLGDNEAHFAREARWGWPRFWQGSAQSTAAWLASRGCRVWAISASYGLSGWIVARNANYHNGRV
jgi:hypothetical protein